MTYHLPTCPLATWPRRNPDETVTNRRYGSPDPLGLSDSGAVTLVTDRSYPLTAVSEALRSLEQGPAQGEVVISM